MSTDFEVIQRIYAKMKRPLSAGELWQARCQDYVDKGNKWYHSFAHVTVAETFSQLAPVSKQAFTEILNTRLKNTALDPEGTFATTLSTFLSCFPDFGEFLDKNIKNALTIVPYRAPFTKKEIRELIDQAFNATHDPYMQNSAREALLHDITQNPNPETINEILQRIKNSYSLLFENSRLNTYYRYIYEWAPLINKNPSFRQSLLTTLVQNPAENDAQRGARIKAICPYVMHLSAQQTQTYLALLMDFLLKRHICDDRIIPAFVAKAEEYPLAFREAFTERLIAAINEENNPRRPYYLSQLKNCAALIPKTRLAAIWDLLDNTDRIDVIAAFADRPMPLDFTPAAQEKIRFTLGRFNPNNNTDYDALAPMAKLAATPAAEEKKLEAKETNQVASETRTAIKALILPNISSQNYTIKSSCRAALTEYILSAENDEAYQLINMIINNVLATAADDDFQTLQKVFPKIPEVLIDILFDFLTASKNMNKLPTSAITLLGMIIPSRNSAERSAGNSVLESQRNVGPGLNSFFADEANKNIRKTVGLKNHVGYIEQLIESAKRINAPMGSFASPTFYIKPIRETLVALIENLPENEKNYYIYGVLASEAKSKNHAWALQAKLAMTELCLPHRRIDLMLNKYLTDADEKGCKQVNGIVLEYLDDHQLFGAAITRASVK